VTDEQTDLANLANFLELVPGLRERFFSLADGPEPDSPALLDARLPKGEIVRMHAMSFMGSAVDHLVAWRALFGAGILPTFAHMTLIRSAVEGASLARWLVDPTQTPAVRVSRGIGARLWDLDQLRKAEDVAKRSGQRPEMIASRRLRELRGAIDASGLRVTNQVGYTDAARDHGPGEAPYRILCAFAHSTLSITMAASILQDVGGPADAGGLIPYRFVANAHYAYWATRTAVGTVRVGIDELESYHGRILHG
jgi:hypothetical protein